MEEVNQVIAGRYRILRKLGEGGFGATWLAQDERLAHHVAIKIMQRGEDNRFAQFFRQEANVLMRINNSHVARVFDYGELEDGRPYLVLEYIEGAELSQLLTGGPLPVHTALTIAEAIADALSAAHAIGIIHRDLKPANIVVPKEGDRLLYEKSKLLDFGVRGEIKASTGLTQTGQIYGTPQYMSPEQLMGEGQSPATDVYGLGAVLYEMVLGEPPFRGETFTEVAINTMRVPVSFAGYVGIPNQVRELLERCLSKNAKDRPRDGSALFEELRRIGASLAPMSPVERVAGAVPIPPPAPTAAYQPSPELITTLASENGLAQTLAVKAKSSPAFIPIVSVGVALITVTVGLWWLLSLSSKATPYPQPGGYQNSGSFIGIAFGLILAALSILLWFGLRKWLGERKNEIQKDADNILLGRQSLDLLTHSLAIEVDEIIERVHRLDDMAIARTLAMMVKEYENAKESKDRQSALMNAVSILEKLTQRLSPWYVRHDKLVAFVVSSVGILLSLVTIIMNIAKIKKGTP